MKAPIQKELLRRAERFLKKSGMSRTQFGKEAGKHSILLSRLQAGKGSIAMVNRVLEYLEQRGG